MTLFKWPKNGICQIDLMMYSPFSVGIVRERRGEGGCFFAEYCEYAANIVNSQIHTLRSIVNPFR